jgi:hypothetical protein
MRADQQSALLASLFRAALQLRVNAIRARTLQDRRALAFYANVSSAEINPLINVYSIQLIGFSWLCG